MFAGSVFGVVELFTSKSERGSGNGRLGFGLARAEDVVETKDRGRLCSPRCLR